MRGSIPVLFVDGQNLPEAWEKSLIALNQHGCSIKTEYDRREDPPSKDSSMTIVVYDPLAEPMIHKDMPGGIEDRTYNYFDMKFLMDEAIPSIREKAARMGRE